MEFVNKRDLTIYLDLSQNKYKYKKVYSLIYMILLNSKNKYGE